MFYENDPTWRGVNAIMDYLEGTGANFHALSYNWPGSAGQDTSKSPAAILLHLKIEITRIHSLTFHYEKLIRFEFVGIELSNTRTK